MQAYQQFDAFRQGHPWTIGEGYALIRELRYAGADAASAHAVPTQFEREMRQLARTRLARREGLPIGFLARRRAEVFLVFRGTMTTNEWVADLKVRLVPCPFLGSGKVHDGFLHTYELFRVTILDAVGATEGMSRLFITGHSLGAGLATLAAADIATTARPFPLTAYTYASPRVGDRQFAADYNARLGLRSYRIANTCDMVVSVPFPVPFLGFIGGYFTHVDAPVDFTTQREDAEKNHDIETYLDAMKKIGPRPGFLGRFLGGRQRDG